MKSEEKQAAKHIYHQPKVLDYGNVTDLTKGAGGNTAASDNPSNKTA